MRRAKIVSVIVAALAWISIATAAEAAGSNAIVDFKTVFDGYPKCLEARKVLHAGMRQIKAELAAKLEKETDKEKRNALVSEYNQLIKQRTVEILTPVVNEVKSVAEAVASSKGFGKVYDKTDGVDGVDITEAVVNVLSQKVLLTSTENQSARQAEQKTEKAVYAAKAKEETAKPAQVVKTKAGTEKTPEIAKAKAETEKTAQKTKITVSRKTKSSIEVQFGADYDEPDITRMVAKALKNGISGAYVNSIPGKNGKKFCRARVPASSKEEAKAISQKLKAIGFSSYVVQ